MVCQNRLVMVVVVAQPVPVVAARAVEVSAISAAISAETADSAVMMRQLIVVLVTLPVL